MLKDIIIIEFIKRFSEGNPFGVHEYKYVILTNSNLKRGVGNHE
jgi:hypothetical protein